MMITGEQVRMRSPSEEQEQRLANNDLRCHRKVEEGEEDVQWISDI